MKLARIAIVVVITFSASQQAAEAADPFTLVVMPDTQNYADGPGNNDAYANSQTRWIRDNAARLNIKFTMHLGDFQNPGNPYYASTTNIYEPDLSRPTGFVDDDVRYQRASNTMSILDNANVPYSVVPGNHDYLRHNVKDEPIYWLKYFGPQRFQDKPTYGGSSPASPTFKWAGMNSFHRFDAGGYTFLNIALQFDPDNNDLKWAQKVINENPGLPTIVTTHAYLNNSGIQPGYGQIWDKFVKLNPQVVITLNGHITGEFHQTVANDAGKGVHQMLVDYQAEDFSDKFPDAFKGGGFLRTMEFDVDAGTVRVKSYSPRLDAYLTDRDSQFTLPLDLADRFGPADHGGVRHTRSFRNGVEGYTGTRDTLLSEADPSTNFQEADSMWIDGNLNGGESQGLLRFNNLFGDNAIPQGATIDRATLRLHTSDATNAQSPDTIRLYRLLQGWTEDGATWDSKGNGISTNAIEAMLAESDAVVPAVRDGFVEFDVTESLWAWAQGIANDGWVLLPGGNNGWRWDTSEHATLANRPSLEVSYRIVPEPVAGAAFACVAAAVLKRRRIGV